MRCPSRTHTSIADYQRRGCRCPRAVKAATKSRRRWYARQSALLGRKPAARLVDGTGTRRRIEGLSVAGWGQLEIAQALGISGQRVLQLRTQGQLAASIAARVTEVTARLSATPGPNGRARGTARRNGWAPLSWWGDIDDPDDTPRAPWARYLAARQPLLIERDVLDDQADLEFEAALDAIDAADEAWFAARSAA